MFGEMVSCLKHDKWARGHTILLIELGVSVSSP